MKTRPPLTVVLLFTLSFVQTSAQADPGDILQVFRLPEMPDARELAEIRGLIAVGDKVVVGAPSADVGGVDAGGAFVFDGSTGDLLHVIQNPTLGFREWFGCSMGVVDEQTVLIGASNAGNNQPGDLHQSGAAYIFDVTTGELLMDFERPTPAYQAGFGCSVAAANDRVLIGAGGDPAAGDKAGAAYMFDRTTGDLLKTYVDPTPGADFFARSVAFAGDKAVISANLKGTGAVRVFDASTHELLQTIVSPSPHENGYLGAPIAPFGSNILVRDLYFFSEGPDWSDALHLFDPATGELIQTFGDPDVEAYFSSFAKVGTNTVLVGNPHDDTLANNAGAVCLFDGDTGELLHKIFDPAPVEKGYFGLLVAAMGNDILVRASDRQAVYLLEGYYVTLTSVATGNWRSATTWDDGTAIPTAFRYTNVGNHTVTLTADGCAAKLSINHSDAEVVVGVGSTLGVGRSVQLDAGTLDIQGTLDAESVEVAAGGSLDLTGTLDVDSLTTAGTNRVTGGAIICVDDLTVDSSLDLTGATLRTSPGWTNITVNSDGVLSAPQALLGAELNVAGTVQTAGADVSVLNVTGAGRLDSSADVTAQSVNIAGGTMQLGDSAHLNVAALEVSGGTLNASADVTTENVNIAGGQLHLNHGANLDVATMQVTGGTVDTGAGQIVISDRLNIGENRTFQIRDGTFKVNSSNLADPAVADNLTLTGGRLTIGSPPFAPNGAIAVWKFREFEEGDVITTADSSTAGNDHLGSLVGAERASDGPDHPTALTFDGDDYVELANAGDIQFGNPFTIAIWIKTSQKGGELIGKDNGDGKWKFFDKGLYVDGGSGQVKFTGPLAGTLTGTTDVASGEWHHVAVTYNGSTAPGDQEIYVDGVNDTEPAGRLYFGAPEMGEVLRLGSAEIGYQEYIGLMDEVYLYDRSLSASEVADLYEAFSSVLDLPNTNLLVTADSALHLETALEEAILGNLALAPGGALEVTGAAVCVNDLTAGNGSSIEGNILVERTLSPGDSPATLEVIGELTMGSTSTYAWELGPLVNDVVALDGNLKLADGWTLQLSDAGGTCLASDQFDLFAYTGSLTWGDCTIDGSHVAASGRWHWCAATVSYDENRVYLTGLTVVPEPSTLAGLISMAVVGLLAYAWRRRKVPNDEF